MNENSNIKTQENESMVITIEHGKFADVHTLKGSDIDKALTPLTLLVTIAVACLGSIIGLELITRVGVSQNTSIIGALIAAILGMLPGKLFSGFRKINNQNLVQTSISGASYAAANAMILPIGIPVLMGRADLLYPMLIGVTLATVLDGFLIYKMFDSPMFPASCPFPGGTATSEVMLAFANRGKRSLLLFVGMAAGAVGRTLGIPMDLLGVSWFGNMLAMTAFAVGSIIKGSLIPVWTEMVSAGGEVPVMISYLPHGLMIGAGLVSLLQVSVVLFRKGGKSDKNNTGRYSVDGNSMKKTLSFGFAAYVLLALIIALGTGIYSDMSFFQMVVWMLFAAFAAIASELVVGLSDMHSGWFPAMATALIFLVIGVLMGFPPMALGVLVAYTAATGPAFTDMANDLKAGWILRGRGRNPEYEMAGRKQQFISEMVGYGVAFVIVAALAATYFNQDLFVPTARTYIATIEAGANSEIAKWLLIWAIPGAIIQFIGGHRQIGILFATGVLIGSTLNGITVLAGLSIRIVFLKWRGKKMQDILYILGAGCIAGSALCSFFTSTLKLVNVRKS